jgi:hypothetical protein
MPDFEKLLRQRLGSWTCPGRDEVVRELAAHLEERFQELVRQGMVPDNAVPAAFEIVGDWRALRTQIAAARRGTMTERARCILIPGAVALLIAALAERLLWPPSNAGTFGPWTVVWVMLVAPNLFAGAAGAAASLYAGGSRRQRIWAAEIPALSALAIFAAAFGWGIVENLGRHTFGWPAFASAAARNLLFMFLVMFLVPAAALLAGALPFLAGRARSQPTEAIGS